MLCSKWVMQMNSIRIVIFSFNTCNVCYVYSQFTLQIASKKTFTFGICFSSESGLSTGHHLQHRVSCVFLFVYVLPGEFGKMKYVYKF
jgi:hypothetical protein